MNRIFKLSLFLAAMLVLSGCLSKGPHPVAKPNFVRPLPESEVIPTDAELNGNPVNVWVYIQSDKGSDQLGLESQVLRRWNEAMRKSGVTLHNAPAKSRTILGQFFDKETAEESTLKDLINHAGYGSNGEYKGKQTVDYVLEVQVNRSTFDDQYSAPLLERSLFNDERNPGSCDYEMEAHLDVNIKPLPEYRTLKSFWLESKESEDMDVFDRCHSRGHYEAKNIYKQMKKEILEDIGDCGGNALEQFLVPTAYIIQYFSDGKDHIFEISGGKSAGFDEGQTVEIYRIGELGKHNGDLLGEASVEEVKPNRSIISVSDPMLVEQLKKYDLVKVKRDNLFSNVKEVSCMGNITEL